MVKWPAGLHRTAQSIPAFGARPRAIPRPPIEAYRRKITGIPLSGGQVQGLVAALPSGSGTVTSPGTFQNIFVFGPIPQGTYTASWTVTLSGTVGAGDANNFRLTYGTSTSPLVTLGFSTNAGAAGSYPQTAVPFTLPSPGLFILLRTGGSAPTAGAVYGGTVTLTGPITITLQIGPQGIGTVWYPVQVTLSTTTGPLDTSLANIYLGPLITPATLVGTGLGNGVYALAIPPMTPGQFLVFAWSGVTPGDTAAANVIGTQDALAA